MGIEITEIGRRFSQTHAAHRNYKLYGLFPILAKEGIKVLGAFCPGKGWFSSIY
jgi:hypothetical protein